MPTTILAPLFVLLWSSGYVVGDLATRVCGPAPLLAIRFAMSSIVLVPLAWRGGRWRGAPVGRLVVIGLLLQVTQFAGAYTAFALGVPAGVSALVVLGLSPLVTTALAIAGGQERADARVWAGLVVGIVGVAVGLLPEIGGSRIGAVGLALVLVSMLGLSGGTVLQRRWIGAGGVDPRVSAAVQSVTALAITGPAWAIVGGRLRFGATFYASVGWLGLGMAVLSMIALVTLLSRLDASRVSALLLLVPAVTAIASAPALGEPLHVLTFVGMAIAGAGVYAVLRRGGQAPASSISNTCPTQPGALSNLPRR